MQLLQFIDQDIADMFHPFQFSEDTMKYVHPNAGYTAMLPDYCYTLSQS